MIIYLLTDAQVLELRVLLKNAQLVQEMGASYLKEGDLENAACYNKIVGDALTLIEGKLEQAVCRNRDGSEAEQRHSG